MSEQRPWYVVALRAGDGDETAVPELVGPFDDGDAARAFADRWRATTRDAVAAHALQPRAALRGT